MLELSQQLSIKITQAEREFSLRNLNDEDLGRKLKLIGLESTLNKELI